MANENTITQRRSDPQTVLKSTYTEELMSEWKTYFEDLLDVKTKTTYIDHSILPADKGLPINTDLITIKEVKEALQQLKTERLPDSIK